MADDTTSSRQDFPSQGGRDQDSRGQEGRQGGNRQGGNREQGGFRIRLSDNEMRAARTVQEAFQLRSTVAALGFTIRTVAQMLEDGQLDELVAQQRSQATPQRQGGGGRPEGRGRDGGQGGRGQGGGGQGGGGQDRAPRANPFARPSKPPAAVPAAPADELEPSESSPNEAESSEADASGVEASQAEPAVVEELAGAQSQEEASVQTSEA
jgi:hypothetical protein